MKGSVEVVLKLVVLVDEADPTLCARCRFRKRDRCRLFYKTLEHVVTGEKHPNGSLLARFRRTEQCFAKAKAAEPERA